MSIAGSYMSPWIFTTTRCNLECPYCYVKQDGRDMSDETYEKMNEIFLKMLETGEKDYFIYRLAGGEPLLVFDKWKPHMDNFLNKVGDKGSVAIITNLTQLSDEVLEWAKDKNVSFSISLDGFSYSKPFHNGESSAEIVKKNIDRVIAYNKPIEISSVIDKNSFDDIEELAEWIAERNLGWGVYLDHFFCGEMDMNVIIDKMCNVLDILKKHNYDYYNRFKFSNIMINTTYEGCTAGEKLITVFVNGDIYPCQTTVYKEKICNIFETDDIIGELKSQHKYKLGYNFTLPEKCQGCAIADICGGGCKENNKEINKNYTCDILKAVILYMLKLKVSE